MVVYSVRYRRHGEQVLLVTGATGVMMASYVVPVVKHLLLYFGK